MSKKILLLFLLLPTVLVTACNKCHNCHYDKNGSEVELGEYCKEDLEMIEANGYTDTTGTYEVHCHEH